MKQAMVVAVVLVDVLRYMIPDLPPVQSPAQRRMVHLENLPQTHFVYRSVHTGD